MPRYSQVANRRGGDGYQFFEIFLTQPNPSPQELIRTPEYWFSRQQAGKSGPTVASVWKKANQTPFYHTKSVNMLIIDGQTLAHDLNWNNLVEFQWNTTLCKTKGAQILVYVGGRIIGLFKCTKIKGPKHEGSRTLMGIR